MIGRIGRGARSHVRPGAAGQATVEFALILPLFFALLVLVFQVALVAARRDRHATRGAGRGAARRPSRGDRARITAAGRTGASGRPGPVVSRGRVGEPVVVEISYVSVTDLPLIGSALPDLTLHATATMSVEQ